MSSGDIADPSFSLTHALQQIARDAGCAIDGGDLSAALGLSFMVCTAAAAEAPLSQWPMYARDAYLVEGARLFGIGVRAIHPPEAACGLNRIEAYRQHFDASYRPLIERALENNQPVLAWQGWPGEGDLSWGIIRSMTETGVGVAGTTMVSAAGSEHAEDVALVNPPVQLYVIETLSPARLADDDLLALAFEHARGVLAGARGSRFGVVMGVAAYDAWIARLDDPAGGDADRDALETEHRALAAAVIAGHQSGIRFLQRRHKRAARQARAPIATLMASCQRIVTVLSASQDATAAGELLRTPDGRGRLRDSLGHARDAASTMLAALESLAQSAKGV